MNFAKGWGAGFRNGRIWSRKARGIKSWARLFRTTAFKLSIAYFVIIGLGFTLAIDRVGENVSELTDQQTRQTIDSERRAADQYEDGGLAQLVSVVDRRARTPGGSIYLVAAPNGVASPAMSWSCRPACSTRRRRSRPATSGSASPMSSAAPWPRCSCCPAISGC